MHPYDEFVPWSVSLIRHSTAQSILERSLDSDLLSIRVVGFVEMFLEVLNFKFGGEIFGVQPRTSQFMSFNHLEQPLPKMFKGCT
jgi:hypothetical protein